MKVSKYSIQWIKNVNHHDGHTYSFGDVGVGNDFYLNCSIHSRKTLQKPNNGDIILLIQRYGGITRLTHVAVFLEELVFLRNPQEDFGWVRKCHMLWACSETQIYHLPDLVPPDSKIKITSGHILSLDNIKGLKNKDFFQTTIWDLISENPEIRINRESAFPQRITRIVWNTNNWLAPSGSTEKSKSRQSFEGQHGFGHDEWLFDFTKTLMDGYHYSRLGALSPNEEPRSGTYDVFLYTIRGGKDQRFLAGRISKVELITHEMEKAAIAEYRRLGFFEQMKEQIQEVGGNPSALDDSEDYRKTFNIRFKPDDAVLFENFQTNLPANAISAGQYVFMPFTGIIESPAIDELVELTFTPNPDWVAPIGGRIRSRTIHEKREISARHSEIQKGLVEWLRKEFEVHPEAPLPGGAKVDIVTRFKGKVTFYEIKTYSIVRESIREALGQLLEYKHRRLKNTEEVELVIVSHLDPHHFDLLYIENLNKNYGLKLSYKKWDLTEKRLVEFE